MAEVVSYSDVKASRERQVESLLYRHFSARLEGMRQDRMSFWLHWAQLARVFLPRRYKWFITQGQSWRGAQINTSIIDETGVLSARILSSGMMAGLTSPTRPWFKLGFHDLEEVPYGPVRTWLAEVERRMVRVFAESNFYQSLGTLYHDNGVFGSASMVIYEDPTEVIRCYNPCLGEFFFGSSARLDIDTLYREFTLTVLQACQQFGYESLCASSQLLYRQGGAAWQTELVICHGIEPNNELYDQGTKPAGYPIPKSFPYREVYWEKGASSYNLLSKTGFKEKPFVGARWDIVSNDAYGRSPGMDAYPATNQLQVQQTRKAQAIDKQVNPPMVASVSMKNEPASILPGAVNYVADVSQAGFKPAFLVDPRLQEMVEDIKETQGRVQSIFFVDLFLMISSLDTVRTATEIDARREEKLVQLGPVIERFENEVLDPIIERTYAIMARRGLLPEAPPEIQGMPINVQYVSMLAEAQRAAATASIERFFAFGGNLAAVFPEILDNYDPDAAVRRYGTDLSVDPSLVRPEPAVAAIRAQKAEQQRAAALMQATQAGVDAAKNLSQTEVGGGINALQAAIG